MKRKTAPKRYQAWAIYRRSHRTLDQVHLSRLDALSDLAEARDMHPGDEWLLRRVTIVEHVAPKWRKS